MDKWQGVYGIYLKGKFREINKLIERCQTVINNEENHTLDEILFFLTC